MKKVLAIMLACLMLVSLLPMGALAVETESNCPGEGNKHYLSNCEATFVEHVDGKCGGYDYDVYACNTCGDYFAANFEAISGVHNYEVIKEATCVEAGEKVCSICGDKVDIEALGHTAGELEGDCVNGWKSVCTVCGEELESVAGEHTWSEHPTDILVEPDEENLVNGLAEYTCTVCGLTKEVVILTHICAENLTAVEAVEPGCVTLGVAAHDECDICGKLYVDGVEVTVEELVVEDLGGHVKPEPESVTVELVPTSNWGTRFELPAALVGQTITFEFTRGEGYPTYASIRLYDANDEYTVLAIVGEDWSESYEDSVTLVMPELAEGESFQVYVYRGTLTYSYVDGPVTVKGDCATGTETVCKYNCAVCGETVEESLGIEHEWAVTYHTEPTCETYGYTIESCVICGEHSIVRHDPLGHSERPEDLEPTADSCTEDAYYRWTCETCGEECIEVIEGSAGCDIRTENVPATCSEYAYGFTYCARGWDCTNEHFVANKISVEISEEETYTIDLDNYYVAMLSSYIDIAGGFNKDVHNATDKANGNVIDPTCTEEGLVAYWCTDCEAAIYEAIDALGHTYGEEYTVEPTCDKDGYVAEDCTVCGYVNKIEIIDAHHTYGEEYTVEPTCGENGYVAEDCTVCDYVNVIEVIEFTAEYVYYDYAAAAECHDLANSEKFVFRAGDCETVGLDRYLCAECEQYVLVRDNTTGFHVMPEDLGEKDPDAETYVPVDGTITDGVLDNMHITISANTSFSWTATMDGTVLIENFRNYCTVYIDGNYYSFGYPDYVAELSVIAGTTYSFEVYCYWDASVTFNFEVVAPEFCAQDATCTEAGWTAQWYCEKCGEFFASEEIAETGHEIVTDVEAKDPTCTESGCTLGEHCANCDYVLESEEIAALGHNVVLVDSQEFIANVQYGYEHYQCTECGYEYIINYKGTCVHEWDEDYDWELSKESTCCENGYLVYHCAHCEEVKIVELPLLDHKNADGVVLNSCASYKVEDRICACCEKEIALPEHEMGESLYYPATCNHHAYIITCCTVCDYYTVEEIDEPYANHEWSFMAWVENADGVIVGAAYKCLHCEETKTEDIECIAFVTDIVNDAKVDGEITDGSLVKVTVSVAGSEDALWGFKFDLSYSSNLTFYKAEFVSENFVGEYYNKDGIVTIAANANEDIVLNSKEAVIELYFVVNQKEAGVLDIDVTVDEVLNYAGEEVAAIANCKDVETVVLMELDGKDGITMQDVLAAYKLIQDGKYNAAADIDKDGDVDAIDLANMYKYIVGKLSYEKIRETGIAK